MRELYQHLGMTGIALSGYGTDADVQNSLEVGFGAHLTKPIDFMELDAAIARVMSDRSQRDNRQAPLSGPA
jgi:CheY-like chemotaxis protein